MTALRIMLVVNEFPPQKFAGTAMATRSLAYALAERGHQVHVVVTTTYDNAVDGEEAPGVNVSWLKDRPIRGMGIGWRFFLLLGLARDWKPDVLQGQAVSCGLLSAMAGKLLDVPSICYAQGMDVCSASWVQRKTEIAVACRLADKVVTVTEELANRLAVGTGMPPDAVLNHGFVPRQERDPREVVRSREGCLPHTPVALHVGRMDEFDKDKGQDLLLEAWALVLRKIPQARLWLVGDGSWREQLQLQALHLGIDHAVTFLGFRAPEEVADYMHAADAFVLPSRYEPFGLVLLEAMYHKLPVMASKVGGVPEVVAPDGDVWLFPPEDAAAMAAAIVQGMQERKYPSAGNHAWSMDFAWTRHVKNFEAMYRELVS